MDWLRSASLTISPIPGGSGGTKSQVPPPELPFRALLRVATRLRPTFTFVQQYQRAKWSDFAVHETRHGHPDYPLPPCPFGLGSLAKYLSVPHAGRPKIPAV